LYEFFFKKHRFDPDLIQYYSLYDSELGVITFYKILDELSIYLRNKDIWLRASFILINTDVEIGII